MESHEIPEGAWEQAWEAFKGEPEVEGEVAEPEVTLTGFAAAMEREVMRLIAGDSKH